MEIVCLFNPSRCIENIQLDSSKPGYCFRFPYPGLTRPGHPLRSVLSSLLKALGNCGMILLTEQIGTGWGFSIAPLNIIASAPAGI